MQVELKHMVYPIKNGFAAYSPQIGLTAHGYSVEVARKNLERLAVMFLRPFERDGRLREEVKLLGLRNQDNGADIQIMVSE